MENTLEHTRILQSPEAKQMENYNVKVHFVLILKIDIEHWLES